MSFFHTSFRARLALSAAIFVACLCVHCGAAAEIDWRREALAVTADSPTPSPAILAAIDESLAALARRQNPDGSFGAETELFGRDPGAAALCGLAFLASGSSPGRGRFGEELEKIVDYLLALSFDAERPVDAATEKYLRDAGLTAEELDGAIANFSEKGGKPLYGHGFATFFLAQVLGETAQPDARKKLRAAVDLIVRTQNAEGGWRYEPKRVAVADLSVTACQLAALRAAREAGVFVPPETIAGAVAFIRRLQNSNGGFRYLTADGPDGFARTATAILALQSGGDDDSDAVRKAFERLENLFQPASEADVPTKLATRLEYYVYGEFYAAQAYWRAARTSETSARWARWARRAYPNLLARRGDDGLWPSTISTDAETAMALCALLVSREAAPFFLR
ncbi:MAG: hypothetical protein HUK22_00600 [Thermoguttaceae bacterium]|nr:hypothetical protein [Thermoguttaceae bacterium]